MIDTELLLKLALESLNDFAALPVLGDALIESGWTSDKVHPLVYSKGRQYRHDEIDREEAGSPGWFAANAATPTPTFARAVAAVLCTKNHEILYEVFESLRPRH